MRVASSRRGISAMRPRHARIAPFAAVAVAVVVATAAAAARATGGPTAVGADGPAAVGALFTLTGDGSLGNHFCTATVVDSPSGDVVVTAAHCLVGRTIGAFAFVPGYSDGRAPFGIWTVEQEFVDRPWETSANSDDDFAFLVVGRDGGQGNLQALTAGERLGSDPVAGKRATVVGYPAAADAPVTCTNSLLPFGPGELEFDCDGYTNGTSGSALVVDSDPVTHLGTVVGVIGGYELGGLTPSVSYAAAFRRATAALFRECVDATWPTSTDLPLARPLPHD